jgi:hypothetical protein
MRQGTRVLGIVLLTAAGILAGAIIVAAQGGAAGTPDEQYKARLAKVDKKSTDQLMGLAKWCIQNNMPEGAIQSAQDTLAVSPDDLRAKYVLFALQGGAAAETTDVDSGTAGGGPGPKIAISQDDADAVWNREGDPVMTKFRTQIQPMLLLRCANPQCHGGNKQAKYMLAREAPGSRRTLAQNFSAINPYINRDRPDESKLIQKPFKGPEMGHPRRVITSPTDPMYGTLVEWIKGLKKEGDVMWGEIKKQPVKAPVSEKTSDKTKGTTKAPAKASEK